MGSSNLTPLTCNPVWALFPVTRVNLRFIPLSDPLLNLWGTTRFLKMMYVSYFIGKFQKIQPIQTSIGEKRYKIRDKIKQIQSKWKGALKDTQ